MIEKSLAYHQLKDLCARSDIAMSQWPEAIERFFFLSLFYFVLRLWLKSTERFVGLCMGLLDGQNKILFSLSVSAALNIGVCQGILEQQNTRGHRWQRRCPCLLLSVLVAKRGSRQCVCTNCLLYSVHGQQLSWSKCNGVEGSWKITFRIWSTLIASVWGLF